jgi:hypothetical protein
LRNREITHVHRLKVLVDEPKAKAFENIVKGSVMSIGVVSSLEAAMTFK